VVYVGGLSEAGSVIDIGRVSGVNGHTDMGRYQWCGDWDAARVSVVGGLAVAMAKATGFYLSVPSQASTELCTTRLTNAARALARAGSRSASAA